MSVEHNRAFLDLLSIYPWSNVRYYPGICIKKVNKFTKKQDRLDQ